VARRAGQGIRHCLAVEIFDRLDRRIGRHVPIEIGRPDHRRSFGEGADRGRDAGGGGDIDAAADQRLDGFRPGLDVEDLEIEPVLLENASALAELATLGSQARAAA
jgi:hypothetical protein